MGIYPLTEDFGAEFSWIREQAEWVSQYKESIQAKLLEEVAPPRKPAVGRIHLARITGIIHDPEPDGKPKYKAISIDTAGLDVGSEARITVPKESAAYDDTTTYVAPITRPVPDTHNVEDAELEADGGGPAGLGELCFIVLDQDLSKPPVIFHGLMLWEAAKTRLCPSVPGTPQPAQPLPGSIGEQIAEVQEEQRRSWG